MIEIFKTNVENVIQAETLLALLHHHFSFSEISFDIDDCDRILRFKGGEFCSLKIIQLLANNGFECEILE